MQYGTTTEVTRTPDQLNDLEIAQVAYTADLIDIQYAHLALGFSDDPAVKEFAKTMARDLEAVIEQALAWLAKLEAQSEGNFLSQSLVENSVKIVDGPSQLRCKDFNRYIKSTLK